MANTYELIASNVLGSNSNTITFSSIPQTYTDLIIRASARGTGNNDNIEYFFVTFNGNTNNYGYVCTQQTPNVGYAYGQSGTSMSCNYAPCAETATPTTAFSCTEFYIPNYTTGSYNKCMGVSSASGGYGTGIPCFNYTSGVSVATTAINTITIKPLSTDTFVTYSSFYLYGIKNA